MDYSKKKTSSQVKQIEVKSKKKRTTPPAQAKDDEEDYNGVVTTYSQVKKKKKSIRTCAPTGLQVKKKVSIQNESKKTQTP